MKKELMKVFVLVSLLSMLNTFSFAKIITTLDEIMKPTAIEIGDKNLYVVEGTTVYIYSLKDFKLVKKFGKKGEGPKEFKLMITRLITQKDNLLVNSFGKISFYTRDGKFIKEQQTGSMSIGGFFYQLKNGYVGATMIVEDKERYITINIFDSNLKKGKVLGKYKISKNGKVDVIAATRIASLYVYDDLIYVPADKGFKINIFNVSGELKKTIKHSFKKVRFTKQNEKEIRDIMKKNMPNGQYELAKNMFIFPEYFPEIMLTKISNNIIYAMTWERNNGKFKVIIFDLKGKLIKEKFLDLKMKDGIEPFPNVIKDNKVYQLIENEETEEWELHVSTIL